MAMHAIATDPQHWEDAEEFKPETERFEGISDRDSKGTNFELLTIWGW